LWFRVLHKDHKEEIAMESKEKGEEFLPNTAKYIGPGILLKPDDDKVDSKEYKDEIKAKTIANGEKF